MGCFFVLPCGRANSSGPSPPNFPKPVVCVCAGAPSPPKHRHWRVTNKTNHHLSHVVVIPAAAAATAPEPVGDEWVGEVGEGPGRWAGARASVAPTTSTPSVFQLACMHIVCMGAMHNMYTRGKLKWSFMHINVSPPKL